MIRFSLIFALLLGGSVLSAAFPAAVRAQAVDPNAEARVHFQRGNDLLVRADRSRGARQRRLLEQALEQFVLTLQHVRSRNALYNAGLCLSRLERPVEAFGYFREYLQVPGLSDEERADGSSRLDAIRAQVGVVQVDPGIAGADVFVDRLDLAPRGQTPLEVAVTPGAHRLFVRLPHHQTFEQRVEVAAGASVNLRVNLVPDPVTLVIDAPSEGELRIDGELARPGANEILPGEHLVSLTLPGRPVVEERVVIEPGQDARVELEAPAIGQGRLVVRSGLPDAEVRVDGRLVGRGAEVAIELPPGPHELRVSAPSRSTYVAPVDIEPMRATHAEVTLGAAGEGSTLGPVPHIALAVTGAAGVATLGLMLRALFRKDDFESMCMAGSPVATCDGLADEVDEANLQADVLLGVTGALTLTTLILYVVDRPNPDEEARGAIEVAATPLPGGGVATVRGAF